MGRVESVAVVVSMRSLKSSLQGAVRKVLSEIKSLTRKAPSDLLKNLSRCEKCRFTDDQHIGIIDRAK